MVAQASTEPGMLTACAEVSGIECRLCSRYHSGVAAIGARPEPLYATILPSPLGWISAKQSPPMPVDCGSITPSRAHAATAASAAVPPDFSTSIAASAARGCDVATIAFWPWTVERPARWKFLMSNSSLYRCFGGGFAGPASGRIAGHLAGFLEGFLAHSGRAEQCLRGQPSCVVPAEAGKRQYLLITR